MLLNGWNMYEAEAKRRLCVLGYVLLPLAYDYVIEMFPHIPTCLIPRGANFHQRTYLFHRSRTCISLVFVQTIPC